MYTLHPDVQFTRRNRLHYILDQDEEVKWSGKDLGAAVEFLIENEQNEFRLHGNEGSHKFLLVAHRE